MRTRTVALLTASIMVIGVYLGVRSWSATVPQAHANTLSVRADLQKTVPITASDSATALAAPGNGSLKITVIDPAHSSSSYQALVNASQHDHGESAFQLFQAIRLCRWLLAPASILSPKRPRDFDVNWCSQIPDAVDYMQWLRQSRDQGYLPAALQMPLIPHEMRELPNADAATSATERSRLVDAMKVAAQAGSIQAMMWLGYAHLGDSEQDRVTNYSYCVAAQQDLQRAMSLGIVGNDSDGSRYAQKLSQTLAHACSNTLLISTAAEVSQAQSVAQSFMASAPCCFVVRLPQ
jgi:hypothetical protein